MHTANNGWIIHTMEARYSFCKVAPVVQWFRAPLICDTVTHQHLEFASLLVGMHCLTHPTITQLLMQCTRAVQIHITPVTRIASSPHSPAGKQYGVHDSGVYKLFSTGWYRMLSKRTSAWQMGAFRNLPQRLLRPSCRLRRSHGWRC